MIEIKPYLDNLKKEELTNKKLFGTFQLNGSLAIHSWYTYITGFSAEFVLESLKKYNITPNLTVLDFFGGVGTTSTVCKQNKIPSISIELNPFACFVAKTKLNWNIDLDNAIKLLENLETKFNYKKIKIKNELLTKYFSTKILEKLLFIKQFSLTIKDKKVKDLFLLALIKILKSVSNCENFAPYFQHKEKKLRDASVFKIFKKNLLSMIDDLKKVENSNVKADIIVGDSRIEMKKIPNNSIDFIITSPPYLNNWDYSWITKLESDFLDLGLVEIKENFVKSSTYLLEKNDGKECLIPFNNIKSIIEDLCNKIGEKRKNIRNGKKFDLIVKCYFNDMYSILKEMKRVMKKDSYSLIVLGDSALYDVHVETDEIIGKIGSALGLKLVGIDVLRSRRASRHNIPLRESVVIFKR